MQKNNPLTYVLPAIYGLCVFLFFWKFFPHHLHFQEQFQLFLFTKNYFLETCSRPGGFSNYAGRFFTQFFLFSFVGAMIVSCFLTGIQQLIYAVIRRFREHRAGLLLSFLPSLYYWYLFCDENSQTGGMIALLLTLISTLIGISLKSRSARRIYLFASIPALYWLAGGTVILSVILLIWYEWRLTRFPSSLFLLISSLSPLIFALSLPFIAKYFLVQYTLSRYWWGVDYIHFTSNSPFMIAFLWIIILLIVSAVIFLPEIRIKMRPVIVWTVQILALALGIYLFIVKNGYSQNIDKEEFMGYDYHCRMRNWDRIIEMANQKSPKVPITVTYLNLALYKTGQLPDKMFEYFQNGPEGLLPTFQRDFMIPTVGGEVYWNLGFVNTAQRFAFEAMEALPDFQKSVRSLKRLVETNLVNGYYEVASKYLNILENTLFYKNWAKETRTFLYDENKINAHPEWGEKRHFQTDKDFMFSKMERGSMLGIMFQQRTDNRMAYEYLMAYTLLVKDVRSFPVFFRLKKDFAYREIPKSWQEALVYIWGLENSDIESIPLPVSKAVKGNVINYANIYTSVKSPEPLLKRQFSKTYWYYFHFRDFNPINTESSLQY